MRKTSYIALPLLLLLLNINSSIADTPTNIKIKIKGVKDSTVLLANHYGDKQYIQDTLKADATGRITIVKKEKYPGGIYVLMLSNKKYFEFIMDETQNFSLETDTADFVKNMKVKGSAENELFYQYLNFIASKQKEVTPLKTALDKIKDNKDSTEMLQNKINDIDKQVNEYKLKFAADHPQTFAGKLLKAMCEVKVPEAPILPNGRKDSTFAYKYFKAHYFDNFDFSDERILRSPLFHSRLKNYLDGMVIQHPDSIINEADYLLEKATAKELYKYIAHYITYTYEVSKIMGMDAVFVHMVDIVYSQNKAFWLDSAQNNKIVSRGTILKPILLGKKTPALSLLDSNNNYVPLYNVKAKYTVLMFWEHSCGHCQKEIPKLIEIYDKMNPQGVEVYAVEISYEPEEWKKYVRQHKLNWINVADPYHQSNYKSIYDIYSTPVIYLLDENKNIKAKRISVEQLEIMLKNMMEEDKKNKDKKTN